MSNLPPEALAGFRRTLALIASPLPPAYTASLDDEEDHITNGLLMERFRALLATPEATAFLSVGDAARPPLAPVCCGPSPTKHARDGTQEIPTV